MKKVIIINGAIPYLHAKGLLGSSLCEIAKETLINLGFNVETTNIANGYDIEEEVEKLANANYWIWQIPGWWMAEPWAVKKYIDEVFTQSKGRLYVNDGRTRSDESKKYGSGGSAFDKKYMLSWTWNLPKSAFNEGEFFDGRDIDEVCYHLHKSFEFLGMKRLPTFMCNDVIKNPDIKKFQEDYKAHIYNTFKDLA
ncbi:flavodoxin-like fold domain-containing protein, putative NAD(P)H (quinone) dehydrogenase/reductase [Campylobacter sp. RM5004]|uniref:NAD(P)H-dependent oxidoreductase n=1 Tax=Campylobacter sp. RM5004 TaxID=1660078 RepID=UPI001EFAC1E2|nr:NAD(P)H-dependent oxidoreductase [Campylobacter sp. RM5004]ULO02370.1 flavodoxin-like fold domain-containing protein, putative NAD(P)H (quinone) dehydrogenase/reductase [Campylobacter sp. RM5004]